MRTKNAGKIAGNNKTSNPSETTTVDKKSNRGRKAGTSIGERPKAYIEIDDIYRIDISDNLNFTVQKFFTRTRINDSKPESEVQYKEGDTYTEWGDVDAPHHSEEVNAFKHIARLMNNDKVKSKGKVVVDEYLQMCKDTDKYLRGKFESYFDSKEAVEKQSKLKQIKENKR